MSNRNSLITTIPLAALALALAACSPPEESPPMDPAPAQLETPPANDAWSQPETADPAAADPVDAWDQEAPPEDGPPTLADPIPPMDPTIDPTEDEVPPPEPEDAGDPVDP